ncbi:MAG: LLM class F420-dependent oxidoreductase [Gammaproteobacteria bacterium]|nr:LLM class F420-dependent oxidoreductase [Gammaproteobacteria bacterium]
MFRAHVCIFITDRTPDPTEIARAVEERNLDGLFVPEHTHIPIHSRSPFFPDGKLPEAYRRTYDPFVALAMAAAVTERIRLGTGICLITQHDPIVLAKTVASLDRLSKGRLILGVGAGWNTEEIENHGTPFKQRWPILRERILAMKRIWRQDEPQFHGHFVTFDPMWSYPKPLQSGGPPIWIGSNSKWVPERVAEYADGWMPIVGRDGGGELAALREACAHRGRRFEELTLGLFYAPTDHAQAHARQDEGYTDFIFGVPSGTRGEMLGKLDEIATLANHLRQRTSLATR